MKRLRFRVKIYVYSPKENIIQLWWQGITTRQGIQDQVKNMWSFRKQMGIIKALINYETYV